MTARCFPLAVLFAACSGPPVAEPSGSPRTLDDRGWILRYRTPDDFGETTSAFTICSFWRAEALALAGELAAAKELFERLLGFANPVGLLAT